MLKSFAQKIAATGEVMNSRTWQMYMTSLHIGSSCQGSAACNAYCEVPSLHLNSVWTQEKAGQYLSILWKILSLILLWQTARSLDATLALYQCSIPFKHFWLIEYPIPWANPRIIPQKASVLPWRGLSKLTGKTRAPVRLSHFYRTGWRDNNRCVGYNSKMGFNSGANLGQRIAWHSKLTGCICIGAQNDIFVS